MKKILLPFTTLLMLFAITPVTAPATKTTFTAELISFQIIFPGIEWFSDGIYHVEGIIGNMTLAGDISGTMIYVEDETVNMETGIGASHGTFVLTIDVGTFAGSFRSKITLPTFSGSLVGQGTAMSEGQKIMGTYEGALTPTGFTMVLEGTILSPKG